jgi:segregation and condensation protein B
MLNIVSQLETILFVASKPLSLKKIAEALQISEEETEEVLSALIQKYNSSDSGMVILKNGTEYQMTSHPENTEVAEQFLKSEILGELTKPQLETLTVISYCGPLTKAELEQIRGVNCSVILRNLMMRGLVKEKSSQLEILPSYEVTMDFVRSMGILDIKELPDYEALHNHEYVRNILSKGVESSS